MAAGMARTAAERGDGARLHNMIKAFLEGCTLEEPYRRQQGVLLRRRVRSLAWVIAVLAVAWIPVDLFGLQAQEFRTVAPLRVMLALALGAVALNAHRMPPLPALAGFITLQCIGFGAMQASLQAGEPGVLRVGYGMFPFVIAVQLAIFPLTWSCALRLASPIALLVAVPMLAGNPGNPGNVVALWDVLWLLALLLALAVWASSAQLSLMRELLHARRDANHDALTGLFNRRAAAEFLSRERARALRQRTPLSVLILDIDHFKRINDRWGHAAGDGVLLALADALRHELRVNDIGVRHGGEEFLVILPAASAMQAFEAAERIRTEIGRLAIPLDGAVESITVSVGVATFDGLETDDALIARADAAMYQAKQSGRNRSIASAAPGVERQAIA
jgi:diguanylate cyclase (GGDEF)-like protein